MSPKLLKNIDGNPLNRILSAHRGAMRSPHDRPGDDPAPPLGRALGGTAAHYIGVSRYEMPHRSPSLLPRPGRCRFPPFAAIRQSRRFGGGSGPAPRAAATRRLDASRHRIGRRIQSPNATRALSARALLSSEALSCGLHDRPDQVAIASRRRLRGACLGSEHNLLLLIDPPNQLEHQRNLRGPIALTTGHEDR